MVDLEEDLDEDFRIDFDEVATKYFRIYL